MLVTVARTSPITNEHHTLDIEISEEALIAYALEDLTQKPQCIQDIFPNCNADEREFIKSGITGVEWESMFDAAER